MFRDSFFPGAFAFSSHCVLNLFSAPTPRTNAGTDSSTDAMSTRGPDAYSRSRDCSGGKDVGKDHGKSYDSGRFGTVTADGGSYGSKGKGVGKSYDSGRSGTVTAGGTEDTPTLYDILKRVKYMQLDLAAVKAATEHLILEAESLETDILEFELF